MDREKILPRVSREERLRYRREGCSSCDQQYSLRRSPFRSYPMFVIAIVVVIGFVIQKRAPLPPTNTIEVSKGRFVRHSFVDDTSRRGLSLLLDNKSAQDWNVKYIIISSQSSNITNKLDTIITKGDFTALFIPWGQSGNKDYTLKIEEQ